MYLYFSTKPSLCAIHLTLLTAIATSLFLFNPFNIDLGVKDAQGQITKPIIIQIPTGAQNPSNGIFYNPPAAGIFTGSEATWINNDSVQHTATADDGSFDTSLINPGQMARVTVNDKGTISYHCTIHPWMTATLHSVTHPSSAAGGNISSTITATSAPPQSSAQGFSYRTQPQIITTLPKSTSSDTGLEAKNIDNWITANHDIYGTRSSNQTTLSKNNVNTLQPKWILNSEFPIENPPLIVGDKGYAQDNAMNVIAFDVNSGLNLWNFDAGNLNTQTQQLPRGVFTHGLTYDNGVIFAPTGANGTAVALNATDGKLIWQSSAIGDPELGFRLPTPPIVWKDYVVVGSALGDEPPFEPAAKGSITAFNRTNGEKIWNMSTVIGPWVEGKNAEINGGGTSWSGGSLDPGTGILYMPVGNPAPDFNATSRPDDQLYTNHMLAVNITNGKIIWATPFLAKGTVLPNVTLPETHDWDLAWGNNFVEVKFENGTSQKIVIGHDKRGDVMAMDAATGKPLWSNVIGTLYRTDAIPSINGSGEIWPGTQYGIEAYSAADQNGTVYVASSSMGFNFFVNGTGGHVDPVFDAIANGVGNGTITAIDIKTGKIKWQHPTEFPTWVSPLVTNRVVFSGHITATGKPYQFNEFGAPTQTPLIPSGIIMALDTDTGKTLWEYNVGAPIGIGGPSIGHGGMLFVTTGSPAEVSSNTGGYIVAFALPTQEASQS